MAQSLYHHVNLVDISDFVTMKKKTKKKNEKKKEIQIQW